VSSSQKKQASKYKSLDKLTKRNIDETPILFSAYMFLDGETNMVLSSAIPKIIKLLPDHPDTAILVMGSLDEKYI
jgi:hypothetical protein